MDTRDETRRIPLAVVGMSCRLPGAEGLAPFWDMLVEGRSAVGDLPPERFDQDLYYDPAKGALGKSYTRRGAIPASREFNAERCPISLELVRNADPTHLVMCQTAAEALRHADMDPLDVPLRNTGVYVGHTIGSELAGDRDCSLAVEQAAERLRRTDGFRNLPPPEQEAILAELIARVRGEYARRAGGEPDLAANMAAGVIAKGFGLAGPFMAVNAACASSLEALLLAGRALQRGRIDMAVVGGASVCGAEWLVLFSRAQALSATDSRPFDHRADGLVVAEAYVALVVKTLERAEADGDPIQAVISGMGVSSDGRGRSPWAPRREGQVEAIRRAYGPGVEMADLQYVEAHATGTTLGDATEIAALAEAFDGALPGGKKIPITSVKANLGHALEAAGLVGVVKAVLCMQKGLIPPAAKIETLNPAIDWAAAPVYVPREATPWPARGDGRPRRAGVNAFGVGGLNVHVVLDEYQPRATRILPSPSGRGACGEGSSESLLAAGCRLPAAGCPLPAHRVDDNAVAVIGLGCVFPGALDAAEYWDLICSNRDPKQPASGTPLTARRPLPAARSGGYVVGFDYDWRRHRIPPKQIELADPLQFMVLDAAEQALRDSGYDRKPFDRRRTGVVVGTEFAGDFTFCLHLVLRLPRLEKILGKLLAERGQPAARAAEIVAAFRDAVHAAWPVLVDETGSFSASSLAGRIIKTWDLMGGGAAIDAGATSGAAALAAAVDLLACGDCDMIVWAAAQRNMTPAAYEALRTPGEGVGALVLKRLGDARRDGDPVRAILRGVEAVHGTPTRAMELALRRSVQGSGLAPGDLALAMTDAAGSPEVDEQIVRAVLESQSDMPRSRPVRLGSVVGQIGHTGGASAAASLLAVIRALEERTMPSVFGLREPIASLVRSSTVARCADRPEPLPCPATADRTAGVVLSQDKGLAWGIVVESPDARPRPS